MTPRTVVWLIVLGMVLTSITIMVSCLGGTHLVLRPKPMDKETGPARADAGAPETSTVLVATQTIPAGALLTQPEKLFDLKPVPKGQEPPGAILDWDGLRNRTLARQLEAGEYCSRKDLLGDDAYLLGLGGELRAMGARVIADDGGTFLLPGCHCDLLARKKFGEDQFQYKLVMADVLVLAVGKLEPVGDDAKAGPPVMTVTLAVTREQAEKLADALGEGLPRIMVRLPEVKPAK